jgi:nucleoside-diphosphate-sugar epimerase
MSSLVIGCGFLGEMVAQEWLDDRQNRPTFGTTRSAERARILEECGIRPVICDVLQMETLRALPQVDSVLYAVGFDRAARNTMRTLYVDGLRNVLDALPGPKRFVYVSSTSVYGQQDGSWVDEESPTQPVEEAGCIQLEAEGLLHSRLPDAVILRFAGLYGPDRLLRQKAVQAAEPLAGDPEKWLNLIHLFDGVEAVHAAVKRAQPGRIYNVADGYPGTRRQYYTELARMLGAPPPRFIDGDQSRNTAHRRIRNVRLRQELKVRLRFPSYEEGLSATIRWMRE